MIWSRKKKYFTGQYALRTKTETCQRTSSILVFAFNLVLRTVNVASFSVFQPVLEKFSIFALVYFPVCPFNA